MGALLQRRELRKVTSSWHGPLTYCAAAMAVLALVCGLGLVVDGRTLMGQSVWLKPFKFAVSFGMYAITLAWMIDQAGRWRRTLWWLGTVAVAGFVTPEIAAITFQAARGVPSHFNFSTGLDTTVFMIMGGAAYLGWLMTFAMGIFLVVQRRVDRAMAWAVPLGLVISLAGMSVGYLMTSPTPDQAAGLARGLSLTTIGAHSVGAPDGGAGMALTGWETDSGDLRVAHFVGLHALQVIPLVAIGLRLLARRFSVLSGAATRTALVVVAAFGYAGLTGLVLWQARRGQALLAPDALTLQAALGLGGLVAACAVLVLAVSARRVSARAASAGRVSGAGAATPSSVA
ncbi:hypothetical protein [Nonomuraea roseoviolacea]|uniref:Uncharacterized membrane protein YhaH (DUF805 family) n=1 Tax=Nonomuraea roseoviolacea subsp. carminata TaxID=160689 RepID=A0ABT1K169_9ACTN|nr:hypothetical protein [Nonomuraea roseoviolacea]MCP2347347.1 uncharacterized membrane protein YhaH (DUF805 family) [Nonomuraea roseoviolacea subsp. carminata]